MRTTRRRDSEGSDGLELLLDTICNVFGGIVFIAILVALLTSARNSDVRREQLPEPGMAEVDTESIAQLEARIEDYERGLAELRETRALVATARVEATARLISTMSAAQERAKARRDELERWLDAFRQRTTARVDAIEKQLIAQQAIVRSLNERLDARRNANVVQIRLPRERRTRKHQVIVLLTGGRLHLVPLGPGATILDAGQRGDVEVAELPGKHVVRPRPGGGFVVEAQVGRHPLLRRLVDAAHPDRHFFDLYLAPDSVVAFQFLRQAIVQRRFEYNVTPLESDGPLVLTSAPSVNVQ